MNFEIERKFLVNGNGWRELVKSRSSIRQAYLTSDAKASIRVRIEDDRSATLCIKSRPSNLRRLELEYPIPVLEAEALMNLRQGAAVEKVRHRIPAGELVWEVDVFSNESAGLVIAEVELRHEQQHIDLPSWVGAEVTGQAQYYNSSLTHRPFSSWPQWDAASARERLA